MLSLHKLVLILISQLIVFLEGKVTHSIDQKLAELGFSIETHNVETKDGFIISPIRILASVDCNSTRVAFFLHGFTSTPIIFLVNTHGSSKGSKVSLNLCSKSLDEEVIDNSLSLALSRRCFDVWLITYRGSEYGLKHKTLKSQSKSFWDWSFDEVLEYDLPAQLDYIQAITKKEKLTCIGHSLGASLLTLLATNPKYEKMLDTCILLGPTTPLVSPKRKANQFFALFQPIVQPIWYPTGPFHPQPYRYNSLKKTCESELSLLEIEMKQHLVGYDMEQFDFSQNCDHIIYTQASVKSVIHSAQMMLSADGQFHKFDYGTKRRNKAKYGSRKPPMYDLSSVKLDNIVIFYGLNDRITTPARVMYWKKMLSRNQIRFVPVDHKKFNHLDFLLAKDVGELLNRRVFQVLQDIYCNAKDNAS